MARRIGCCYAVCVLICVFAIPPSDSEIHEDAEIQYSVAGIDPSFITSLKNNADSSFLRLRREVSANNETTASTPGLTTQQPLPTAQSTAVPSTSAPRPTTPAPTQQPSSTTTTTTTTTTTKITTTAKTTPAPTQRPADTSAPSGVTSTLPPIIKQDNHSYYISTIIPDGSDQYFIELDNPTRQDTLSSGHRVAVTINLPFAFRFYGHNITNITVATGGFIYMSPFLHQWLTATQYIAPLMANFDTSDSDDSNIFYKLVGEEFIIEWHAVNLKDQSNGGPFIFQTKLKNDGTITFVYKTLPLPVVNISSANHPVKIGLSDAFYNDTFLPEYGLKRRTIIEYHRVSFLPAQVEEGTVIILQPIPTCNTIDDCETCARHVNVRFKCRWCDKVQRCSDGLDWYRQEWETKGCSLEGTDQVHKCVLFANTTIAPVQTTSVEPATTGVITRTTTTTPNTTKTSTTPTTTATPKPTATQTPITVTPKPTTQSVKPAPTTLPASTPTPTASAAGVGAQDCSGTDPRNCKSKAGTPVAVIVVVVLIVVALVGAAGIWVFYAYTHPTSASGIWLMEHRPSAMKAKIANIKFWKSSTPAGTKYQVESQA